MTFDHRQAQTQHLPREVAVRELRLELAQAAALAEDKVGHAPLLALRKARRIDVAQQVSAVAVVVVVRDHHAHLVQGFHQHLAASLVRFREWSVVDRPPAPVASEPDAGPQPGLAQASWRVAQARSRTHRPVPIRSWQARRRPVWIGAQLPRRMPG